ncbi:M20/M25/M40 family metallo-hydrolase [Gryllotalpicola protaetiae]|uniref:M20/M25/M40 family metallo-hydrolase n=1 Tax=Gryllotalpicola protaetiae TaxID=2419771 RepID=A0A387BJF6_9MICO|nr:M20/M25/M40 family metallo-hydrolase [Gryllotalpicola protaetiae]AYG03963.1 M20/M25/M40 family metallo-hydrolase [Gryllotalpicola protaetiae]
MTEPSLLEREALQFAQELIRIESVNPGVALPAGDGEARTIEYIRERLADAGYEPLVGESVPGRANLVLRIPGSDPARGALLAHAHVDVVAAQGEDWTHPPFGGAIADGFLWGRGALDLKNYAAVLVAIARHFAREGVVPRRELILAFFSDEESGGVHGVRWVRREHPEWLAGATEALGEVGGFSVTLGDKRAYLVATAEKGVGWVRLRARGDAGHASRPSADNAVTRIAAALARLGEHRFPATHTPALDGFLAAASRLIGVELTPDNLEEHLDELGVAGPIVQFGLRHTVTPTVVAGGYKSNVIPGEASAELDTRSLPGPDAELKAVVQELAGPDVELTLGSWVPPLESPTDSPLLDILQAAIAAEDPDGVVVPYLLPASTDNKHLASLGIAGYGFVPLRTPPDFDAYGLLHAADERIPLESLFFSARVTERILREA